MPRLLKQKEIVDLKKRVQKLERKKKSRTSGLKRLWKVGSTTRVESSEDKESLGDQEDVSKQKKMIDNIDQDVEITLVDETHGRMNEEEMFRVNDLDGDEVIVDATAGEKVEQHIKVVEKEVSTADPVTTAEPEKPLEKKDQIEFDEEVVRKLEAQMKAKMEEEERIVREKDEANIALIAEWDDVQAMMDADHELAERLQAEEQGELTIGESSKLFVELINERKTHFARIIAEEKRRKPPTKAQKRKIMYTYLKNMAGFTHNHLKNKALKKFKKLLKIL
uniref:Uncharacterized protein n=1 Tax=Tanacetum cinerariifolium TaxID=118510 RepID=A0A6L2MHA9_TANCI|nr:hypothetical protein [Tanacetum cinerariifolium]